MALTQWTTSIDAGDRMLLWGVTQTNLGSTLEGSTLRLSAKKADFFVERYGDTPYEKRLTGFEVQLEAILLQKDMDNLATVLLGQKNTSVVDIDPRPRKLTGAMLELRPVGAADNSNSIIIFNCVPIPDVECPFSVRKQEAFRIRFEGVVDENASGAIRLLRIGDPDTDATKAYFPNPA